MNFLRPRTLLRSAIVGVAAIAMASCSGVHPGSAAVVDGESISMGEADKASVAYCKLALADAAQQGKTAAVSKSATRRQSVTDLITFAVVEKLVEERDLQLDPNTYVITDEQKAQIAEAVPDTDQKQIIEAIERSQKTYAATLALGEEVTGKAPTEANTAEIEQAGQAEITKAMKSSDISIDPRFGLDDAAQQVAASGSLSVAEVTETEVDPAKLPAAQRCS